MLEFITRSIPRRMQASLLGIFAITYIATAIVVYSGARSSILDSSTTALSQLAALKHRQLANLVTQAATNLRAWAALEVMNDLVSGDVDRRVAQTLEDLKRLYDLPGDIFAFDNGGHLTASSRSALTGGIPAVIPKEWEASGDIAATPEKTADPVTGQEEIFLSVPIFGSFDASARIGTLVVTYPWTGVEQQLFSTDTGTILVNRAKANAVIASDRPAFMPDFRPASGDIGGFIVGYSRVTQGPAADWQVLTLQVTKTALRPLRQIEGGLVLLGVLLAIPIAILGRWLSRRLTAPIADLTRAAQQIADTEQFQARVPVSSSDELGILARSFNRMTEALEHTSSERAEFVQKLAGVNQTLETKIAARTAELKSAVQSQQRLIADISHEIKSPLARLTMALGLAGRVALAEQPKQLERMEGEIRNISDLASELLVLARLNDTSTPTEFAKVDIAEVIGKVVADATYESPHRISDISFMRPERPLVLPANAPLLSRAIENVVRNALFYTFDGTSIEIRLAQTESMVSIAVCDFGPGVPEAALSQLFEPFYRVDEARTRKTGGAGIGLAICKRAVELHGGTVRARENIPHGLIVEIALPVLGNV